ncbi:hypothetical protein [Streptomyces sp. CBMA156]|uniref:hypothetical protein n=1 Tax=Streptomyces sp. CBMA156 TaxID=1930280 RepID=UPI001661ED29|nr:hypothetical protein [Streptomyces sp. CBMA156]MBD0673987.1 hypothetical protein [Streptomyces sp. CBMA156]
MSAITEEQKVAAVYRLGVMTAKHPALKGRLADTRLELAAAIIALDAVEERIQGGEKIHSLQEQTAVEQAKNDYAQALAELLRGES